MTTQQFIDATVLKSQIDAKKKELSSFEQGKITSLNVRLFDINKKEYEDKTYTTALPNKKIKGIMLELLKNDLSSLEFRFNKLFENETQHVL